MRTIAKDKTSSAVSEGGASETAKGQDNWFRMHWCLITLCVIAVLTFVVRFAFSYGISAGDGYALSGGSSASSHHRIITEILWGTYNPANDLALNYPYGSASVSGPLFDYCCAAWAKLFSAFGMSYDTAASAALAWNPPLFAALTIIPVFLVAKKIFKDNVIGVLAGAFYAAFPLLIMTSPFSYGTELAFICFLVAWLTYFVICALSVVDAEGAVAPKDLLKQKKLLKWVGLAVLFMTFIVYSWTGYWAIIMAGSIILLLTLVIERIGGRDMTATVIVSNIILLVPALLAVIYYGLNGMWDAVCSGPTILAVLIAVYSIIFLALQKKPWVATIPLMAVIIFVVSAVLAAFMPELFDAIIGGNVAYTGELMSALVSESSRTSMSAMASYYGWLTVWCPLFLGVWMAYKYRKEGRGKIYNFVMLWLLVGFFAGWFSSEYAVLAGTVFAVASAAVIVKIFRHVDVLAYFRSLRGNGFQAGAKKALNFFPLVTVLVAALLVAAPAAVYAADAATPTNNEHADYFGGLGYTINTSDSSLVNAAWSGYSHAPGASMLTWYGYSNAASSVGGYNSVTSTNGGGTSAMSSALLSSGSSGAVATFIIRGLEGIEINDTVKNAIATNTPAGFDVDMFVGIITDVDKAQDYFAAHYSDFTGYNSSVKDESLPYITGVHFLQANLSESEISQLYSGAIATSDAYILVDGSMIPRYYGDGTSTNSIAYFGDYSVEGKYGTPSKFYSITSLSEYYYQYYGYALYTYTDAMYDSFLWNALLGVAPASNSYNDMMNFLNGLSMSDGTIKATPGVGFDSFNIAYWHVLYYADADSKGVDMDINSALALQNENGGYINYLSSVIIYQYAGPGTTVVEGTYTVNASPFFNAKVAIFEKLEEGDIGYDPSGAVTYVQRATTFTDENGKFSLTAHSSDFLVKYYAGATNTTNGEVVATKSSASWDYDLGAVGATVCIKDTDGVQLSLAGYTLSLVGSDGKIKSADVTNNGSEFQIHSLVPDIYTATIYDANNTKVITATLNAVHDLGTVTLSVEASVLKVTVKDMYGNDAVVDTTVTFVNAAGVSDTITVSGGTGSKHVVPGTYTVSVANSSYVSTSTSVVTIKAGESKSAEFTVYAACSMTVPSAGTVITSVGYNAIAAGTTVYVPANITGYLGTSTDSGVTTTGTVKKDGNGVTGTVFAITADGKEYAVTAKADGTFSIVTPTAPVTMYVTNNKEAYIGGINAEGVYELTSAVKTTITVNYETKMSGNSSIAYVPVLFTVTSNSTDYSIYAVTNTSGQAFIYLPSGSTVKCTVDKTLFTGALVMTKDFTATSSDTLNFKGIYKSDADTPYYVKSFTSFEFTGFTGTLALNGTSAPDVYVTVSSGNMTGVYKDEACTESTVLIPGTYTITSKVDGIHIDETVKLYPSSTAVELDAEEYFKVVVKGTEDKYEVITDDGSVVEKTTEDVDSDNVKETVFKLLSGCSYVIKVTNTAGDKIFYSAEITGATTVDYTLKAKVVLSGYIGSALDGTIVATDSASRQYNIEVKAGAYTVDLEENTALQTMVLDATGTKGEYDYSVSSVDLGAVTLATENKVVNFLADTSRAPAGSVTLGNAVMNNGVGTVDVTIEGEEGETYYIAGSSAFVLDQAYSVTIPAAGTITQNITGYYSAVAIGAGNENASVTVTKLGAKEGVTKIIPVDGTWTGVTGSVTVSFADAEKELYNDVDGHAYKYLVSIKNENSAAKSVSIAATVSGTGWIIGYVDSDGYYINQSSYTVKGLATTSLYVVLVNESGDYSNIPGVHVAVTGDASAESDLEPQSVSVSVSSGSVSGGNADNNKATVSTGFWILLVITILLLLLLVWASMKRGVIGRSN